MPERNFVRNALTGNAHWAFYLLTLLCVAFAYIAGQLPLTIVVRNTIHTGNVPPEAVSKFWETLDFTMLGIPVGYGLLLLVAGHIFAGLGLILCNKFMHKRPVRSLFTGSRSIRWGRVGWSFTIWIGLSGALELLMYVIDPANYSWSMNISGWISLVAVTFITMPLQATVEELVFRGYIMPRIAAGTRFPIAGLIVTSILFTMVHMSNPEVREFGNVVMVIYYTCVGVFLGAITLLDDGLELAIGVHAATNVYGAAFVSFDGSVLQTYAPLRIADLNAWWVTAAFLTMIAVFWLFARRKYRFNTVSSLFVTVDRENREL